MPATRHMPATCQPTFRSAMPERCDVCHMQIVDDAGDLLSERTATEDKKLNKVCDPPQYTQPPAPASRSTVAKVDRMMTPCCAGACG
jgi:hypothetical protein